MKPFVLTTIIFMTLSVFAGRASFSVLVLDSETDQPIKGIKIEGSFLNYSKSWGVAAKDNDVDAYTDANGMARLSGNTESGKGGFRIYDNEGYYNAEWREIRFAEQSLLRLGAWLPSGIVSTARLDRVVNPVPLIVRHAEIPLGKTSEGRPLPTQTPISYDLFGGDWLPPYGNGEFPDIKFTISRTDLGIEPCKVPGGIMTNEYYRYDVDIKFLGDGNGLIEMMPANKSQLKIRNVPVEGYQSGRMCWRGYLAKGVHKDNYDRDRCYAFRTRTELDDEGNIKNAHYGKIYGDFRICESREKVVDIDFLYYLNPTPNDRNLEWDRKHNLCPAARDIDLLP